MIRTVFRKIKNKAGLNFCLFLGIFLLVGVFSCHPSLLYGGESLILKNTFENYIKENNLYPAVISRNGGMSADNSITSETVFDKMDSHTDKWTEYIDVDVCEKQYLFRIPYYRLDNDLENSGLKLEVWTAMDLEKHIQTMIGEDFVNAKEITDETGVYYPCFINEYVADVNRLVVGEKLFTSYLLDGEEKPLQLYVAGVFRKADSSDNFWATNIDESKVNLWISNTYMDEIINRFTIETLYFSQNVMLDYTQINPHNAHAYLNYSQQFEQLDTLYTTKLTGLLEVYARKARSTELILFALEIPSVILLLMFISMVIGRILASEESEIAVWRSRGFKKKQILLMYIIQTVLIGIPAYAAGIALGYGMCLAAASTNSFMEFVSKDISFYILDYKAFYYGAAAVGIVLVLITPLIMKKAKLTVVNVKSANKYNKFRNISEKLFLDVILLGISVYLLVNYEKQKDMIISDILAGKSQDPVIFMDASLFIFACGLLVVRLGRYLINLIYAIARRFLGAASYAATLQTKRTYSASVILSVFLVMTIAGGIFNASLASSINSANVNRVSYDIGCDVRLKGEWKKIHRFGVDGNTYVNYIGPDYDEFAKAQQDGIAECMTKVIIDNSATVTNKSATYAGCQFMGIITDEFGETAELMSGLNQEHWYNALNALAVNSNGVIISRNLAEKTKWNVGAKIKYSRIDTQGKNKDFIGEIVYIVDAFPGYEQFTYEQNSNGGMTETEHYLVVANYADAVTSYGISPYEIWTKLAEGRTADEIKDAFDEYGLSVPEFASLENKLETARSDAVIQVINGIFTISFLICSVITVAGFLIYWIVSIKSRELLFGVYRAMGMHMGEIGRLLFTEVLFCSIIPALGAVGVGILTTQLFSRLTAYVCLPERHTIPLNIGFETDRLYVLGILLAFIVIICFWVIKGVIRRMNIAQAIKLGED